MQTCSSCDAHLDVPVYVSSGHRSLTTMMSLCDDETEVFFCDHCGHLQTREIVDIEDYYAHVYSIWAGSEEEDQLYQIVDGRKVFQTEHRVNTLMNKIEIPRGANVLDVGCAKGMILKEICRRRPDVTPHFFEISDRYVSYWEKTARPDQWATGTTPASWKSRFDVVTSFYVLEHVDQPVKVIGQQAKLLALGGTLYFIVPNVYANTADFVVADHLQHFSENSLIHLLERCGLEVVDIDDSAHESALVVAALKVAEPQSFHEPKQSVAQLRQQVTEMSQFWSGLSGRIREFERSQVGNEPTCIYGAGFYGNFIASCLASADTISCFVDQNPHLQDKPLHGRPVVAPDELAPEVSRMYVGLNPARARDIIAGIEPWKDRRFECFYL